MRSPVALLSVSLLATIACADAPVTADQLDRNGALRGSQAQFPFSVVNAEAAPSSAQLIQLSAVLASQARGPLQDQDHFSNRVKTLHLHVRAEGLQVERPVQVRWIHGDQATVVFGVLSPSGMVRAASVNIAPHQVGPWTVEILTAPTHPENAELLFTREFTVEL